MFRERVAVAFITLSLVMSAALAYVIVKDYSTTRNGTTASAGDTTTATDNTPTDQSSAAPTDNGGGSSTGSGGSAGSSTTTTGGSTASRGGGPSKVSNNQAASGVSGDKITVGGIFDMTGAVDSSVERDTVRAYFSKINAAGGINGRKLVMIDCDSRYDNVAAHTCSSGMVSSNVLAIVGWTAPKGENDEVRFLVNNGIPIIGGLGTPEEYNYHLSYPVSVPFTRIGTGIAARAQELGIKHPAIVYINDVPWVAPVLKALTDALHARGITETHVEAASATQADYSGAVNNLKTGNDGPGGCGSGNPAECPDGLITALDPFSYSRLFNAMDRFQWHPKVLGGGLDKGSVQEAYGDQLQNAFSLVPFLSPYYNKNNATVQDYLSTVEHYYPSQVPALDIYTQHSWTSAMVFVEAVKRAGKDLTRQSLVNALDSIQNFDTGWSKPISYGPGNHDPNHCFMYMDHDPKSAPDGTWHQDPKVPDWQCF